MLNKNKLQSLKQNLKFKNTLIKDNYKFLYNLLLLDYWIFLNQCGLTKAYLSFYVFLRRYQTKPAIEYLTMHYSQKQETGILLSLLSDSENQLFTDPGVYNPHIPRKLEFFQDVKFVLSKKTYGDIYDSLLVFNSTAKLKLLTYWV